MNKKRVIKMVIFIVILVIAIFIYIKLNYRTEQFVITMRGEYSMIVTSEYGQERSIDRKDDIKIIDTNGKKINWNDLEVRWWNTPYIWIWDTS